MAAPRSKQEFYLDAYGRGLPVEERTDRLLALARGLSAERLLDIGCGDGSISLALKDALGAAEVHGVEISPKGVEEARRRGVFSHLVDVDAEALPFPNDLFDLVYAGEIIEHLYDPDNLLNEIFRVLRPDGFVILDTPNLASWHDRLSLLLGFQPQTTEASLSFGSAGKLFPPVGSGAGGHLRVLTLRALLELLSLHGFAIRRTLGASGKRTVPLFLPPLVRPLYWLASRVFSRFPSLATFVIVLAQKDQMSTGVNGSGSI